VTPLQENLLARGPFDVTFRELAILGECLGFYRFEPASVHFFRAKYPQTPIKIDNYAYLIETSGAGPRIEEGRIMRLIQFDITDPRKSVVVEEGTAAVKRMWKALEKQGIDIERGGRG
jgi:hypothetical protein